MHRKKDQPAQDTAKQMIDDMMIDDVERLAHWIGSEDEGGTFVGGAGAAAEVDITLEQGLKLLLKSVGGVVDDACPALYPTYVSFLHAQVNTRAREGSPTFWPISIHFSRRVRACSWPISIRFSRRLRACSDHEHACMRA